MKYIKLYEATSSKIILSKIVFSSDSESVSALYIDGFLEFYGDEYHNDISAKIDGFIDGLKWVKENYLYPLLVEVDKVYYVKDENLIDDICNGGNPPKELDKCKI